MSVYAACQLKGPTSTAVRETYILVFYLSHSHSLCMHRFFFLLVCACVCARARMNQALSIMNLGFVHFFYTSTYVFVGVWARSCLGVHSIEQVKTSPIHISKKNLNLFQHSEIWFGSAGLFKKKKKDFQQTCTENEPISVKFVIGCRRKYGPITFIETHIGFPRHLVNMANQSGIHGFQNFNPFLYGHSVVNYRLGSYTVTISSRDTGRRVRWCSAWLPHAARPSGWEGLSITVRSPFSRTHPWCSWFMQVICVIPILLLSWCIRGLWRRSIGASIALWCFSSILSAFIVAWIQWEFS